MDGHVELEELRLKLWNRYVSLRSVQMINIPFSEFWHEFLARYIASEQPPSVKFEDFLNEFNEKKQVRINNQLD